MHEHFYYHAIASFFEGSYRKITKLKGEHKTWQEAYEKNQSSLPSPEKTWESIEKYNLSLILFAEEEFPASLKELAQPPHALYFRGSLESLKCPCVAMVGTRKATAQGKEFTKKTSAELARHGLTIISGLARGIDCMAHQGALSVKGKTVAVLAQGLSYIYPMKHEVLAKEIVQTGGAVISEYPPEFKAQLYSFLERNRLVSGLSRAIVAIEAPARSGTLSTAKHAVDQNRDVLVVPGPVYNPNYIGSHGLIKEGAELVCGSEDILQAMGIKIEDETKNKTFEHLSEAQRRIVAILERCVEPAHIDLIVEASGLDSAVANSELSDLLINEYIKEDRGFYFLA